MKSNKQIYLVPDVKTFNIFTRQYTYKNKLFTTYEEALEYLRSYGGAGSIFKLMTTVDIERTQKVTQYDEENQET